LTPSTLGQLVALDEHTVFVKGVVSGVNCFDQWGVELGKAVATLIAPLLAAEPPEVPPSLDSSTVELVRWVSDRPRARSKELTSHAGRSSGGGLAALGDAGFRHRYRSRGAGVLLAEHYLMEWLIAVTHSGPGVAVTRAPLPAGIVVSCSHERGPAQGRIARSCCAHETMAPAAISLSSARRYL